MALSVMLMFLDHYTHYVNSLRSGLDLVIYPVRYIVNIPSDLFDWSSNTLVSRDQLQENNDQLRTQNQILKAQLQKLTFIEAENIKLRELLKSSKRVGERILISEILAVDLDPFQQQVVINKGSDDGQIYPGQPILNAEGVMGQVVHVTPVTSTAMLITDPNHSLPVEVVRNGLRTIAVGMGASGNLELLHLPNNADIKVGDMLVTSGFGCVFPAGYPAAKVIEASINPKLPFMHVIAVPMAKINRSRDVLLVWLSDESRQKVDMACGKKELATP